VGTNPVADLGERHSIKGKRHQYLMFSDRRQSHRVVQTMGRESSSEEAGSPATPRSGRGMRYRFGSFPSTAPGGPVLAG
jgi:hypothetical protein